MDVELVGLFRDLVRLETELCPIRPRAWLRSSTYSVAPADGQSDTTGRLRHRRRRHRTPPSRATKMRLGAAAASSLRSGSPAPSCASIPRSGEPHSRRPGAARRDSRSDVPRFGRVLGARASHAHTPSRQRLERTQRRLPRRTRRAAQPRTRDECIADAKSNLDTELHRLREIGATADGAVGDPDPMKAIEKILAQRQLDEIILSTLPPGISRWLAWDLPHRVRARTDVPLTVITSRSRAGE
jgi:hypothetical protein